MTKLRTLILVLVLCGVAPTASADDFWTDSIPIPGNTAPLFGALTYGTPVVVAPAVVAPARGSELLRAGLCRAQVRGAELRRA